MPWPSPQEYNEAIQNPRVNLADVELAAGKPEVTALGLPRPITGNFASVYRLRCGSRDWAVRCFWREYADMRDRYTAIGEHLARSQLPSTVGFDYLSRGIRVGNSWYPLLRMEWVDGSLLTTWIAQNLGKPEALRRLAQEWLALTERLERAGVAHCDLQHGNVLVGAGGLRLVDYDAMFVPALGGRGSHELGHQHYQHPARSAADFNARTDRFSAWVIYLSLAGIAVESDLWALSGAGDESLLLRREDYENPGASAVLRALDASPDLVIRRLTETFVAALDGGPNTLQSLSASVYSERSARRRRPTSHRSVENARLPDWLREHVPDEAPHVPSYRARRGIAAGAVFVPAATVFGLFALPADRVVLYPTIALSVGLDGVLAALVYLRDEDGGTKATLRARLWFTRIEVTVVRLAFWRPRPWSLALERVCVTKVRRVQRRRDQTRVHMLRELATVATTHADNEASRAAEIAKTTTAIRERRTAALNARREKERRRALKQARLRVGAVSFISAWQVFRLRVSGIHSAADVDDAALSRARRFGPDVPVALRLWRAEVERAAYRSAPASLSEVDENRLRTRLLTQTERTAHQFARRRDKLDRLAAEICALQKRRDDHLLKRQRRWEARVERRLSVRLALTQESHSQCASRQQALFDLRRDLDEYADVSFANVLLRALALHT